MSPEASGAVVVGGILPMSVAAVVAVLARSEHRSLLDGHLRKHDPGSNPCSAVCGNIRVTATDDAVAIIRRAGGLVFLTRSRSRVPGLHMSVVAASCEPPLDALAFRRLDAGSFLLFIDPAIREPHDVVLDVACTGHRQEIVVHLDGFAYVT